MKARPPRCPLTRRRRKAWEAYASLRGPLLPRPTTASARCSNARARSHARHWHDLASIARSPYFASIVEDHAVAAAVAPHKSCFFIEKDTEGAAINYISATQGHLRIVPEGRAREALAEDYAAMRADDVMIGDALSFEQVAAQVNPRRWPRSGSMEVTTQP